MSNLKIRKFNVSVALFMASFFYLHFIGFAAILILFFLYQLKNRSMNLVDIRRAGIPALAIILLIGLISTATLSPYSFSTWNFGKDIYFFLAPIMMLMLGLTIIKDSSGYELVLKTSVITLTIISIIQFSDFLLTGKIFNASLETRYEYGMESTAATLALLLIISLRPSIKLLFGSAQLLTAVILNLLMIAVSMSRVNIAIAFIALTFLFSHTRILRATVLIAVSFLVAAPLFQIPLNVAGGSAIDASSFFNKILNSLQEIRISDYSELSEINENWRGYEAFLGVNEVLSVGGWANFIGLGFGSFAAGPFEGKLEQIPFFHNGFITIFLKSGILGIAVFSFFVKKLYTSSRVAFLHGRSISDPRIVSAGLLIILLTTSILLRTLSTHGIYYSRTTLELFFIGLSIYVIRDLLRKNAVAINLRKDGGDFESRMLPKAGPL